MLTNPCVATSSTQTRFGLAAPGGICLAPPAHEMSSTLDWYREGGPIMIAIALVGAAGIAVFVERLYVIVLRSRNNGRVFIERLIQLVRAGKIDDAIKACAASTAALPDIGLLILRSRSRDETDLQNVAGAAVLSVVPRLTRRLQYLRSLSTVAILAGAFGTLHAAHNALVSAGAVLPNLGAALTPA